MSNLTLQIDKIANKLLEYADKGYFNIIYNFIKKYDNYSLGFKIETCDVDTGYSEYYHIGLLSKQGFLGKDYKAHKLNFPIIEKGSWTMGEKIPEKTPEVELNNYHCDILGN